MVKSHDSTDRRPQGPADTDDLLAGATMLLIAARARVARRSPRRFACLPFLNLGQPAAAAQSGATSTPGGPLLWSLLPLASLLPWASLNEGPRPSEHLTSAPAPAISTRDHDDRSSMPGVLGALSLRAPEGPRGAAMPGPRWAGAMGPGTTPVAPEPAVSTRSAQPAVSAPLPGTTPPTATPAPAAAGNRTVVDAKWSVPLPRPLAPSRSEPVLPSLAGPTRHRWESPLITKSPVVADKAPPHEPLPPNLPTPRLPVEPPAPSPRRFAPADTSAALPWPGGPRAPIPGLLADGAMPSLRSAPAQITLPQVLQTIHTVVEQTITVEVARVAARIKAASTPAPAAALEFNSEYSVRKLMAMMRQIEQDERLRGGKLG